MGRHWIGIEMGDHAETHCKPRLDKVIEGEQGGISEAVKWQGGGGYRYYRLGPPAFDATGRIEPDIAFDALAAHIWFAETGQPAARSEAATSPLLGVHDGIAYALLYNGILGDRRPEGGNVLTPPILADLKAQLPDHYGPWVIYGEACKVPSARLKAANVTFKQTPYDVKAR
jgi:adenine-specific DNA-methyltransferase